MYIFDLIFIFLYTGGESSEFGSLKTSQHLSMGKWREIYKLETPITNHCMLRINSTFVMIFGGKIQGMATKNTYFLNHDALAKWKMGPEMLTERYDLQCSKISMGGVSTFLV